MKKVIITLIICISIFSCAKSDKTININKDTDINTDKIQSSNVQSNGDIIDTLKIEPYRHGTISMGGKNFVIIGANVITKDSTYSEDFILMESITLDMIKYAYSMNNGPFKVVIIYDPKLKMDKVIFNIIYK